MIFYPHLTQPLCWRFGVLVCPNHQKSEISGIANRGYLKVTTKKKAKNNEANDEVTRLLAKAFSCEPKQLIIHKGKRAGKKIFLFYATEEKIVSLNQWLKALKTI